MVKTENKYNYNCSSMGQMPVLQRLIRFARRTPREQLESVRYHLEELDWYWKIHKPENQRTTYVISLFGGGRLYLNELMLQNIGERTKYFRKHLIRLHPGPTSFIYSYHATIKYASRFQESPAVTTRILEAVRSRFADLIFIYRHPLDSLLSNWVWWRTYLRNTTHGAVISDRYKNTDDLCEDLDQNFLEFKAFADGDPHFYDAIPGPRFLSFPEFVEETELYLRAATLSLRLEDFMVDPRKEFAKVLEVMSVDLDSSRLSINPPKTRPYRYLAVKEKVPSFKNFIDELNGETKKRIERIGYQLQL